MPNVKFTIEYSGAKFHGWQEQVGVRTIQGELKRVLELVLRQPISGLTASGRTDAGVHARAQVVNFRISEETDLFRLKHAVSNILRGEVSVLSAEYVPESFNSQRSATAKHYRYVILNRVAPAVLDRGRAWYVSAPLNLPKMEQAALELVGERDFSSFQGQNCQALSPVKEIFVSRVTASPPYVFYDVWGSGFLKHMVRNIVGTLVGIGRGRAELGIPEILAAKDRRLAGVTAPAYGLVLNQVYYGEDPLGWSCELSAKVVEF